MCKQIIDAALHCVACKKMDNTIGRSISQASEQGFRKRKQEADFFLFFEYVQREELSSFCLPIKEKSCYCVKYINIHLGGKYASICIGCGSPIMVFKNLGKFFWLF